MSNEISKENVHKGHRERMKDTFLKNGLSGFSEHEIIELLLFFGIPMKDTNEIAHHLLNSFGSISDVFNAHYEDLIKVKGMTKNAAVFLKMMPDLFKRYVKNAKNVATLDNIETINEFFTSEYFGA